MSWTAARKTLGSLSCMTVMPSHGEPTHLLVLCHGFGAPGDDLFQCGGEIASVAERSGARPLMVFPQGCLDLADEGLPGGRAWWRLNMARLMQATMGGSFDELRNEVPEGIDEAREMLVECIGQAIPLLSNPSVPVLLGGFSQGAMLAVDTALRGLKDAPQGLILWSGALICESAWREAIGRLSGTRILQSHGRQDNVLPLQTGQWLHELMLQANPSAKLRQFDGPHTIPMEAFDDLKEVFKA